MTLCFDPDEAVARLRRRDRRLARIIDRAGPFTLQPARMVSPYASLLRAIVGQQLSGKAAETIFGRVAALHPDRKRLSPEALRSIPDEALRGAGLSRNKLLALRDLADKTLDGTVPTMRKLRAMDDAAIVERLTAVRGIGVWTVEMMLMFKLGRPDVLPIDDLGVRQGFMHTYGLDAMPKPREVVERAEPWRPFRSVGSWYMWRAVELQRAARREGAGKRG